MENEVERLQARLDELKVKLARQGGPDDLVALLLAEIDETKDRLRELDAKRSTRESGNS